MMSHSTWLKSIHFCTQCPEKDSKEETEAGFCTPGSHDIPAPKEETWHLQLYHSLKISPWNQPWKHGQAPLLLHPGRC